MERDIVLSIDVVEPGLVNAVHLLSKELGRPLKGIALVHRSFLDYPTRPVDTTGLFEEVVVDYDNPDELQKTILPFMDRILLVTTRYEDAMHHFSKLVPFVPYVYTPTESSLIWSTEKPMMRDRLKAYDPSLVPEYRVIRQADLPRWEELVSGLTFPVIVKPGSLWSSFLVTRCDSVDTLGKCLHETYSIIDKVYGQLRRVTKPALLVEEMIQGDMYSTDVYVSHDGVIHCLPLIKVLTAASLGLPGFYGHTCIVPADLSENEVKTGYEAAQAAVRALGLRSTTVHIELFLTKNGWKIIELGARIGGRREPLYREAYGIEHHYNDLANRAGMVPKITTDVIRHARSEDIFADAEGIVESVEGVDEARNLESMVSLNITAEPGDRAIFADKGGDTLAEAILSNPSKSKVEADAAELRRLLKFKIKQA
jgi:hypothetical protein